MTSSERLFWNNLSKKSFGGYKFLRKHPVSYRLDTELIEFFII
jgi:very-short-patch-repair endonuclease